MKNFPPEIMGDIQAGDPKSSHEKQRQSPVRDTIRQAEIVFLFRHCIFVRM